MRYLSQRPKQLQPLDVVRVEFATWRTQPYEADRRFYRRTALVEVIHVFEPRTWAPMGYALWMSLAVTRWSGKIARAFLGEHSAYRVTRRLASEMPQPASWYFEEHGVPAHLLLGQLEGGLAAVGE